MLQLVSRLWAGFFDAMRISRVALKRVTCTKPEKHFPQRFCPAGHTLRRALPASGLWPFVACSRPPRWGRQSCLQAAFRPLSALNRVTQFALIFSGFVCRRHGAAKPEKFASKPRGGLKPACSQDWLPHEAEACPTKTACCSIGLKMAKAYRHEHVGAVESIQNVFVFPGGVK
jgi:hypothetical protein